MTRRSRTETPATLATLPSPAPELVETELSRSQKRAALGLLAFIKSTPVGPRNKLVANYQWAMGRLVADGTIGPKTRARALALGALLPRRIDVPLTDPERL
jgi:hypothetical protein